ncbi:hypothetical protein GSI_06490 [Ganoderma sinense ZZ0214-1]|uniref:Uncharacterized protein n=1 Tax=Ganoderma sinense ZZ0214-1 TaxID=1077348 RepID=A0A2G8SDD0_9APHY|nr:hypothetical protein GSI_06490 [Ganoderma sinense ZZ0214-1]
MSAGASPYWERARRRSAATHTKPLPRANATCWWNRSLLSTRTPRNRWCVAGLMVVVPSARSGPRASVTRRDMLRRPNLSREKWELCDADHSRAPPGRSKKSQSLLWVSANVRPTVIRATSSMEPTAISPFFWQALLISGEL